MKYLGSRLKRFVQEHRGMYTQICETMLGGKKKDGDKENEPGKVMGFEMTADMMTMMNGFTVLRLLTMAGGMMGAKFTKEDLLKLNAKLSRIKQPKPKKQ